MYMRFNETTLLLIFSTLSSETTTRYRFGRKVWTVVDSESRIVSKTVSPNLLVIRLARVLLSVSKELILTAWHKVASSNYLRVPFARNLNSYCILCLNVTSANLFLPKSKQNNNNNKYPFFFCGLETIIVYVCRLEVRQ